MNRRSKSSTLLRYLGMSFGWLIFMTFWVLVIGPYTDPRCNTSASFGFLPMAMVVPFLMLPLYALSVAVHAVFAIYKRRFDARVRDGVPLFGLDAVFFIPFTLVSLIAFSPATHWDKSLHCFFLTCAIVLPWITTPVVNTRLLAWNN
jgi:hypothetical protein